MDTLHTSRMNMNRSYVTHSPIVCVGLSCFICRRRRGVWSREREETGGETSVSFEEQPLASAKSLCLRHWGQERATPGILEAKTSQIDRATAMWCEGAGQASAWRFGEEQLDQREHFRLRIDLRQRVLELDLMQSRRLTVEKLAHQPHKLILDLIGS